MPDLTRPTDDEVLPVTQADRDAAADWCASQPFPSKQAEAPLIREGSYDHHSLAQAFARYRLATPQPPTDDEVRELKPCPFCGGTDAFVERADYSSCYVICNDCSARGPVSCDENEADAEATESGTAEPGEMPARRLWDTRATPQPPIAAEAGEALAEAARGLVDRASDTYRKRNGHIGSIEGDDGEKCWIVSFDDMEDLRRALRQPATDRTDMPEDDGLWDIRT
jgi:Lar family restriction alleviation protein